MSNAKVMAWVFSILLGVIGITTACGDTSSTGDSDRPVSVDDSGPVVVNFPDGFMNIAHKCLGPNGLYAHTRAAAPVVVPNDPLCKDGSG